MAYQSVWFYSDIPEEVVDIIERDLTEKYQDEMSDSKLHGDALNKNKRNSLNAWVPILTGLYWVESPASLCQP